MSPRPEFPPAAPRSRLVPLLALIPFLFVLTLAWWSVDFGYHWDEDHNKINAVAYSLDHGFTLLPDGYTYPGVNYWLTLGTLLPEIWQTTRQSGPDVAAYKQTLTPFIHSPAFHYRLRRVYAFVAALTGVWIFLAILVWGGTARAALFGSLLFASSFEVLYHARWIAPDPVLMQFGALTLLFLALAWKRHSVPALYAAAAAAGLACGSKYPGALLMTAVWALALLQTPAVSGWWPALRRCTGLGLVFLAVYLQTTPGTLLQPITFFQSLKFSQQVYAEGWYGYTVTPGASHLWKMVVYFATAVFSADRPVALVFFACLLVGIWAAVRENPRTALLLLIFPVIYGLYFSRQATMVVRNYLVMVPFAVCLVVQGAAWIEARLPKRGVRVGFACALGALLLVNLADQIQAAASVAHPEDTASLVADFAHYADQHPDRRLLVSERLADGLRQQGQWPKANLQVAPSGPPGKFAEYASFYSETVLPRELDWPTNRPRSFAAVFGPRDVNLDYYTGWKGGDRIICLRPALAREAGVLPR
jgi:hypothetical protein